ncbi:MAG: hypothetical protein JWP83_1010 [Mycobacterium sp.]|jgi:hypothetical protein|nr:hypothetical protein [Mycobacterium sp.]
MLTELAADIPPSSECFEGGSGRRGVMQPSTHPHIFRKAC